MPAPDAHVLRDAGAAARAENRLTIGLIDRRLNELAKAKIAAQNLADQAGGGTKAGRKAAQDACLELLGLTPEELEGGLNGTLALDGGSDTAELEPGPEDA